MQYAFATKPETVKNNGMGVLPSGTTVTRKLVLLYHEFKKQIKSYFHWYDGKPLTNINCLRWLINIGLVHFTTDLWTTTDMKPYMAVTAHWITASWESHSLLLDFFELPDNHTGENISTAFFKCLDEFDLIKKVSILINYIFMMYVLIAWRDYYG